MAWATPFSPYNPSSQHLHTRQHRPQRDGRLHSRSHDMAETHVNSRLEAFCDGVFAIALTLLIIDIKIPASTRVDTTQHLWHALKDLTPSIFAFLLSFAIILITWVNHHATLRL